MPAAALSPVAGNAYIRAVAQLSRVPARSLYLYENDGEAGILSVPARSLYLYENDGEAGILSVAARSLYCYENDGEAGILAVSQRDLYCYEMTLDTQVTPWLMALSPVQQYPGGQVQLFGDGLGQYDEMAASATITTSSVNGSAIGSGMVNRTVGYWQSAEGSTAWCQFTWPAAQPVSIIVIEGLADPNNQWGVPQFDFSDGLGSVIGSVAVPQLVTIPAGASLGYPTVGWYRAAYALPAIRNSTYVKISISSGGTGSLRGLGQVWVLSDNGKNAEPTTVWLNTEAAGITGVWLNRSPGLWPANGGVPVQPAGTMTVPADGVSGLVKVTEP